MANSRKPRLCNSCTNMTTAKDGICRECAGRKIDYSIPVPYDFALTGGRWVRDGLVQRWQPDQVA